MLFFRIHRVQMLVLAALLISLLVAGCQRQTPTPTPEPTATPAATATPVPTATSLPPADTPTPVVTPTTQPVITVVPPLEGEAPKDWNSFTSDAGRFTVYAPQEWQILEYSMQQLADAAQGRLASDEVAKLLDQFTTVPAAANAMNALGVLLDDKTVADPRFAPNFTVMVLPGDDITLDFYADAVAQQMASVDGVELINAGTVAGLRPGGADIAFVRYRLDGNIYDVENLTIEGWQFGLYDGDGKQLLIITFTAPSERLDELEPIIEQIVAGIRF
jgi:hypothetical protein